MRETLLDRSISAAELHRESGREPDAPLEPWLIVVLIVAISAGIFLRFNNLEGRTCWHDECFSRMRIAGFESRDLRDAWSSCRQPMPVEEVKAFMHSRFTPGASLPAGDILRQDLQNSPLYFWTARIWARVFGESIASLRCFSIITSLATLPLIYMLGLELFRCRRTSSVIAAILAAAPVFVIYAQQIRHYPVWLATILLASLMLLRAVRQTKIRSWAAYAVSLALAFLANPLSLFLATGHALFIGFKERFRLSSHMKAFCVSAFVALLAFLPRVFLSSFDCVTGTTLRWLAAPPPGGLPEYVWWTVFRNSSRAFWQSVPFEANIAVIGSLAIFCLLLVVTAHLVRNGSRDEKLFVGALVVASFLPLICRDVIMPGRAATVTRYLFPALTGVVIAVGFLFARQTAAYSDLRSATAMIWRSGFIALILVTLCASFQLSSAPSNWTMWPETTDSVPESARLINGSSEPLVLIPCNGRSGVVLVLADRLRSGAQIIPLDKTYRQWQAVCRQKLNAGCDVFSWDPGHLILGELRSDPNLIVEQADSGGALWKLGLKPYKADLQPVDKTLAN